MTGNDPRDQGKLDRGGGKNMNVDERVDCQIFGDQLDVLVRGELPEEGMRHLRLHADGCQECAMQLKVQETVVGPSLKELEAQVPDDLLTGVWGAVATQLREDAPGEAVVESLPPKAGSGGRGASRTVRPGAAPFRRKAGWLVPSLAAASLILLVSTGVLARAVVKGQSREALLTQQVSEQRRWMSALELGPSVDPVVRTAALAGRSPWTRALSRQESISIRGLEAMLRRMPGDPIVLTQDQVDAALRSRIPLTPPFLRGALSALQDRDGVRATDLLRALEALEVDPDQTVPTAELLALLS
jgi:hypothetical protein